MQFFAFTHNSTVDDGEPAWGSVDKTKLPRGAFADEGEADKKSTWGYPHHWVKGGGGEDENGIYTTGTMYLHRGGLGAAWAAVQGGRSGQEANLAVKSHLDAHRKAIGMGEHEKKEKAMSWYQIKAQTENSEIWLYDEIGLWGIKAKDFIDELNMIKSPKISMHINSPGGEVFDGAAMYNAIKRHPAFVTTYIDGIAASEASIIALAGDKVIMAKNAIYMMHNPSGLVIGTSETMRETADILDKIRDTMVGTYMDKCGKTKVEIISLLDKGTWMNGPEAKDAGFVDEVAGEIDLTACLKFVPTLEKSGFKEAGKVLNAVKGIPSARDCERVLRDEGCSSKMAKTILAKGYSDALRDEDSTGKPDSAEPVQRDVEPQKPVTNDDVQELLMSSKFMRSQK
jgi:ATP-dependent Clp protease protease subunit